MTEQAEQPLEVLLVEANPNDARLIESYLRPADTPLLPNEVSLTHEETLEAGLDHLTTEGADILLLDLGLRKSTGVETFDRAREHVASIPVIVLTGRLDQKAAVDLLQEGAQDFLNKSQLDANRLHKSIRYALECAERERKLADVNERLERQHAQLEFLTSILRHDLLNGMTVIKMRAATLADELDGEQAEDADAIVQWSENLVDISERVRTMSDRPERSEEYGSVYLSRIVDDQVDRVASAHSDLTVETDIETEVWVRGDDLLSNVVGNLLTNSVEHSQTDDLQISISVTGGETATVQIEDDGVGIPDDRKEAIFRREETATSLDSQTGTGFGLFFVDRIIDEYGGDVWVEDGDQGGARFVLELPGVPPKSPT
jgi:signal transduction histidine kinase